MRTFLLFALLCVAACTAQAQNFQNNTNCTLRLTPLCYDPGTCGGGVCSLTVNVPPGASIALPVCSTACTPPNRRGYMVAYGPGTNCNVYVNVGDPKYPCTTYPASNALPPCPNCGSMWRGVSYDINGNLIVQ